MGLEWRNHSKKLINVTQWVKILYELKPGGPYIYWLENSIGIIHANYTCRGLKILGVDSQNGGLSQILWEFPKRILFPKLALKAVRIYFA